MPGDLAMGKTLAKGPSFDRLSIIPKDVPLDPWGRPYEYKYPGDHGEDPDVISLGADGQPGGDGTNADIVSWSNK